MSCSDFVVGSKIGLGSFAASSVNVSNHFVERKSNNEIIVKKMKMIPMECVVRGYFYGSLVNRWKKGQIQVPDG